MMTRIGTTTGAYLGEPTTSSLDLFVLTAVTLDTRREYFLDGGGRLAKDDRANLLHAAGHRRCSIDLSGYLCRQVRDGNSLPSPRHNTTGHGLTSEEQSLTRCSVVD
jgi:hypothetical protein